MHHIACRIFVDQTGINPMPPVLAAQRLNHWITWEVHTISQFKFRCSVTGFSS